MIYAKAVLYCNVHAILFPSAFLLYNCKHVFRELKLLTQQEGKKSKLLSTSEMFVDFTSLSSPGNGMNLRILFFIYLG